MKSEFPRQIVLSVSAGVTHFVASGLVLIVGIASLVSWGTGAGLAWLAMGLAYIAVSGWFFWCSRDTQERIELAADHLRIRRPSAPLFLRERDSIIPREDIDRIVLRAPDMCEVALLGASAASHFSLRLHRESIFIYLKGTRSEWARSKGFGPPLSSLLGKKRRLAKRIFLLGSASPEEDVNRAYGRLREWIGETGAGPVPHCSP